MRSGVPYTTHMPYSLALAAISCVMGLAVVSACETAMWYAGESGSLDETYPVSAISGNTIIFTPLACACSIVASMFVLFACLSPHFGAKFTTLSAPAGIVPRVTTFCAVATRPLE